MPGKNKQRISFYFRREKMHTTVKDQLKSTPEINVALKELKIELERINMLTIKQPKNYCVPNTESKILEEIPATQSINLQKIKQNKLEPQKPLRRSARNLPESKKIVKPDKEEPIDISSLPSINFRGKIKFAKDFYTIATYCDKILQDIEKCTDEIVPIGFDMEWPFNFQTGSGKTAMAQICLSENVCYLLHIYNLTKLPAAFAVLLKHPKVKLVGVNVKNDVWKLTRDFQEIQGAEIVKNNCMDSGVYYNRIFGRSCRWSLERLTAQLLNKRINKSSSVRQSKWHFLPLSDQQKSYAATDAYVSWLLHIKIAKREKEQKEKEESSEVVPESDSF